LLDLAVIVWGANANIPSPGSKSLELEAGTMGFREIAKDYHENMKL
jgi:hypothetical protein